MTIPDYQIIMLSVLRYSAERLAADNVAGRPMVQAFVGALHGQSAMKGVFITTSSFSCEATD